MGETPALRKPVSAAPERSRLLRAFREAPAYASRRLRHAAASTRAAWWRLRARAKLRRLGTPVRACLGSGDAPVPGWVNADIEPGADLRVDLRFPLPFADSSVDALYSEHVIEHLSAEHGLALLAECRRVLRPGGVLRIATPDLAELLRAYDGDWRDQDWVSWPGHEWIDSGAMMLNVAFRAWGHLHLYDHAELERRMRQAGFAETRRCPLGQSEVEELAGLETREDSTLIVEAWGAAPGRKS